MPPTRRSRNSGGPVAKGNQRALSFSNSKVTKNNAAPRAKENALPSPPTKAVDIDVGHVTSEAAVAQQAQAEINRSRTAEEEQALRVTDAQIRRYWKAREAERRTPRVHQEELSVEEKILRLFDMSSQYGVRIPFPSPLPPPGGIVSADYRGAV